MNDLRALACPRCASAYLSSWKQAGNTLHACGGCGGIWVGHAVYARAVHEGDQQLIAFAEVAAKNQRARVADSGEQAPCPECSQLMSRMCIQDTGVWLDICSGHGVWFDCEELRQVATWAEEARRNAPHFEAPPELANQHHDGVEEHSRKSTYNPHLHLIGSAAESVGGAMVGVLAFVARSLVRGSSYNDY
jgi:Zn-finger nucleic acid-binding protein